MISIVINCFMPEIYEFLILYLDRKTFICYANHCTETK